MQEEVPEKDAPACRMLKFNLIFTNYQTDYPRYDDNTYTGGVARKRASSSPDAVEGVAAKRRVGDVGQEDLVMMVILMMETIMLRC